MSNEKKENGNGVAVKEITDAEIVSETVKAQEPVLSFNDKDYTNLFNIFAQLAIPAGMNAKQAKGFINEVERWQAVCVSQLKAMGIQFEIKEEK